MEIKIIENEKEKIKMEVADLTFVNLLNEVIWKQKGVGYSVYNIKHPYLSKPVISVTGKTPKKIILDAAAEIAEDAKTLRKKFQMATK